MSVAPPHPSKDFLSLLDLPVTTLDWLLETARALKDARHLGRQAPTANALAGMHVAMLFQKPSLRTRSTFEIAIRELGGDALYLPPEFADGDREPIEDVARNLERWVHALVLRTFAHDRAVRFAAAAPQLHVINALTDEQHPCQALADAMTMHEHWGSCTGRTVAYVGDGNNVAASLTHVSARLGISLRVASPPGYELSSEVVAAAMGSARDGANVQLVESPRAAVVGADAVYTDVWASMGQETEAAARQRVFAPYRVTPELMASAAPDALFMHCLPAHRGEEVDADVLESPASVVFDQAENRLHTQKALLLLLLG
jgi:ornithine carbamoyltransferase